MNNAEVMEQFKINIETAVQKAKQYSNDIFLVSILPFSDKIDKIIQPSGKIRYNDDVLVYNSGIWAGMRTVRYFDGKTYEWVGISRQPNIIGKVCSVTTALQLLQTFEFSFLIYS